MIANTSGIAINCFANVFKETSSPFSRTSRNVFTIYGLDVSLKTLVKQLICCITNAIALAVLHNSHSMFHIWVLPSNRAHIFHFCNKKQTANDDQNIKSNEIKSTHTIGWMIWSESNWNEKKRTEKENINKKEKQANLQTPWSPQSQGVLKRTCGPTQKTANTFSNLIASLSWKGFKKEVQDGQSVYRKRWGGRGVGFEPWSSAGGSPIREFLHNWNIQNLLLCS